MRIDRALLLFLLLLVPGLVQATDSLGSPWATRSIALAACTDQLNASNTAHPGQEVTYGCAEFTGDATDISNGYAGHFYTHAAYGPDRVYGYTAEDPPNDCASKPGFHGSVSFETGSEDLIRACHEGCEYYGAGGAEIGNTFTGMLYPYPAGVECTEGGATPPAFVEPGDSKCIPQGALSTCYRPSDGKICAVTPRGAKACWSPGEFDTKVSPDQKEALTRSDSSTPPAAPEPLQNAQTSNVNEHAATSPTTGVTYFQTITYANVTGVPGTATTGTTSSGSGTGTTPAGNGTGSGSGEGTGDGDGAVGEGVGDGLYDGTTDTYASVLSDHLAAVQETPIVSSVQGFFVVTIPSSSCPALVMPEMEFMGHAIGGSSFTWHCSGTFHSILVGVGVFLLIAAAWAAFRWAFGET
jgi:hypothetical protein